MSVVLSRERNGTQNDWTNFDKLSPQKSGETLSKKSAPWCKVGVMGTTACIWGPRVDL